MASGVVELRKAAVVRICDYLYIETCARRHVELLLQCESAHKPFILVCAVKMLKYLLECYTERPLEEVSLSIRCIPDPSPQTLRPEGLLYV